MAEKVVQDDARWVVTLWGRDSTPLFSQSLTHTHTHTHTVLFRSCVSLRLCPSFHSTSFPQASAIATWVVELAVPCLFFVRGVLWRRGALLLISTFMVAIHFTGNFATFNILTVLLMIPVWADDDGVVAIWAHTPGSSSKSSSKSSSSSGYKNSNSCNCV